MLKHLTYLYRCRELKLVPSSLSIKTSISFRIAWRLVESARHGLTSIAFNVDKTRVHKDLYKSYNEEFEKVMAHQIWKLKQMKDQSWSSNKPPTPKPVKVVVNISKHLLSTFEETMLKSLKFVTTIRQVQYFDTIASTETSLMIPMA